MIEGWNLRMPKNVHEWIWATEKYYNHKFKSKTLITIEREDCPLKKGNTLYYFISKPLKEREKRKTKKTNPRNVKVGSFSCK